MTSVVKLCNTAPMGATWPICLLVCLSNVPRSFLNSRASALEFTMCIGQNDRVAGNFEMFSITADQSAGLLQLWLFLLLLSDYGLEHCELEQNVSNDTSQHTIYTLAIL